ncbi:MAG: hypothetical protein KDC87_08085, partial [Planctomycetes bacterium]|nr:hypothetical protein [Planctomycetota bacterium]
FAVRGRSGASVSKRLWEGEGILTTAVRLPDGREGVRVSPHVYTSLVELDRFCEAVERAV